MKKKDMIENQTEEMLDDMQVTADGTQDAPVQDGEAAPGDEEENAKKRLKETLQKIKDSAVEEDPRPSQQVNLRTILGGDLLTTQMVRSQIWLFVLIVGFALVYVAFRYQCEQDMIKIDQLETQLEDAKFKAMSSSSTLTGKCRESHVLEILKHNGDSLLQPADQPPFIIEVPE